MQRSIGLIVGIVLAALVIIASQAFFVVNQMQQAIVLQLGQPIRVVQDPGLNFKLPFIQNVEYLDRRVLALDPAPEQMTTQDQTRLVVDTLVRYRIKDPLLFYQALRNEAIAEAQINRAVNAETRNLLGTVTLGALLSEDRTRLLSTIRERVNPSLARSGVEVVDVRIRRADLPEETSQAIFARMRSERQQRAALNRAEGEEKAQAIRSEADRERIVLVSEATRQSQILRGEGDKEAIGIYAQAFGKDPQFFSFYRSMEAYRNTLTPNGTSFLLSPDSAFFRYFNSPNARPQR
jgi:membrane protease subunit HflC